MSLEDKIKIGCDLDGVVAKHSLGGLWVKLRILKERMLKKAKDKDYYYPKTELERFAWKIINWLRVADKEGTDLLKKLKGENFIFYLVTSRLKFNYSSTIDWLKKRTLLPVFEEVLVNVQNENPVEFKVKAVEREKINYFIDDDLEVLTALCRTKAKLFWVIPGHRNGEENHEGRITNCQSFADALGEIAREIKKNRNNIV